MSDHDRPHEFLSMPSTHYPSDEDLRRSPVQPALDTLFSEFARRHRSLSPSTQSSPRSLRGHMRPAPQPKSRVSILDLRSLDYVADYDSHLMCPICHIPFIDPIVLDCDHTFCASCFSEYRRGGGNTERSQCPSCRSYVLSSPRKASRLIQNMCHDAKVRCPNGTCSIVMARGSMEYHATKTCPEQKLACPDTKCEKKTKRKNYVPEQCVHNSQVECDCGAIIALGRGEWLKHKDQDCPNTCLRCEDCGEHKGSETHECLPVKQKCPGAEFGCVEEVSENLDAHIAICTFARLAPHLQTQSRMLHSLQEQLSDSRIRNQTLETELDRMHNIINNQIQPRLDQFTSHDIHEDSNDHETDIEEIPRDNIPSAAAIHHRDLLLPAHIRDLTPSPDLSSPMFNDQQTSNHVQMHNHLLYLHESLRHTVSNLEADMTSLHHAMAELDARTSMQLMNETLRIKEDLAYTNAALVSHRSQVQWLLNRERMGREQAILRERGRMAMGQQNGASGSGPAAAGEMENQTHGTSSGSSAQEAFPFPSPAVGMTRTVSGSGGGSGPSSTATSPMFTGIPMVGSRRPSMRGGSQERVKL